MLLLSPHAVCIIGPSIKAGLLSASPRRLLDLSIDLGYRCLFPHSMETGRLRHLLNQKCGHLSFFLSCCFFFSNNKLHSCFIIAGCPLGSTQPQGTFVIRRPIRSAHHLAELALHRRVWTPRGLSRTLEES